MDWIGVVEKLFNYIDILEEKKVKLIAYKLNMLRHWDWLLIHIPILTR